MTSYYVIDDNGDWKEADENTPGAKEYDEDAAYEYVKSLKTRIEKWDHEDIRELRNLLDQVPEALRDSGRPPRTGDVIDLSSLPSEEIPAGLETYPIWAMDIDGNCLVGDMLDEIEHVDEIKENKLIKPLLDKIQSWNKEDVNELKKTIDRIYKILSGMKSLHTYVENYVDLTDLPSEDIPRDHADYPIWAIDKSGNCLIDDSDGKLDIKDLEEIKKEWG